MNDSSQSAQVIRISSRHESRLPRLAGERLHKPVPGIVGSHASTRTECLRTVREKAVNEVGRMRIRPLILVRLDEQWFRYEPMPQRLYTCPGARYANMARKAVASHLHKGIENAIRILDHIRRGLVQEEHIDMVRTQPTQ